MKKMSKRMLGVLLICSFIISCSAGCGSNIEKTSNNNQNIEYDTMEDEDISSLCDEEKEDNKVDEKELENMFLQVENEFK